MKKFLLILIASCFLSHTVLAQGTTPETDEETNAFGYPDKSLVAIIENTSTKSANKINAKPDCANKQLMQTAQDSLKAFLNIPSRTITNKRRHDLVLKNIANFTDLPIKDININLHRSVAARLVELKINKHLTDDNIKICQSDNPILSTKIYLVIYDKEDDVVVEIINFQKELKPSFIWHE